jgi:hypothetical protein
MVQSLRKIKIKMYIKRLIPYLPPALGILIIILKCGFMPDPNPNPISPTWYYCPDPDRCEEKIWRCNQIRMKNDILNRCIMERPDLPSKGDPWICWDDMYHDFTTKCKIKFNLIKPEVEICWPWSCHQEDKFIVCKRDKPEYPYNLDQGRWRCDFEANGARVCLSGKIKWYKCTEGEVRWCDLKKGPSRKCGWGKQACDNGKWEPCIETLEHPNNACGCRHMKGFNPLCCEDQNDRDKDGFPDCIIPKDHKYPECEIRGDLCSYCEIDEHCGDYKDLCITDKLTFASYCGRDCKTKPCPVGYKCIELPKNIYGHPKGEPHKQCVPTLGYCQEDKFIFRPSSDKQCQKIFELLSSPFSS